MRWSTSRQLLLPPRSREERAGKETRKKSVIVPCITVHARERLVSTSATLEIIETYRKRKHHPTKESTVGFSFNA